MIERAMAVADSEQCRYGDSSVVAEVDGLALVYSTKSGHDCNNKSFHGESVN